MTHDDPRDERLAKLLAASRAEANPAVLARVRARLAARERAPGVVVWLGRPAVLAGAGALFVLSVTGAFVVARQPGAAAGAAETSLVASVLGDEDLGLPIDVNAATSSGETGAAGDSGGVTP